MKTGVRSSYLALLLMTTNGGIAAQIKLVNVKAICWTATTTEKKKKSNGAARCKHV